MIDRPLPQIVSRSSAGAVGEEERETTGGVGGDEGSRESVTAGLSM